MRTNGIPRESLQDSMASANQKYTRSVSVFVMTLRPLFAWKIGHVVEDDCICTCVQPRCCISSRKKLKKRSPKCVKQNSWEVFASAHIHRVSFKIALTLIAAWIVAWFPLGETLENNILFTAQLIEANMPLLAANRSPTYICLRVPVSSKAFLFSSFIARVSVTAHTNCWTRWIEAFTISDILTTAMRLVHVCCCMSICPTHTASCGLYTGHALWKWAQTSVPRNSERFVCLHEKHARFHLLIFPNLARKSPQPARQFPPQTLLASGKIVSSHFSSTTKQDIPAWKHFETTSNRKHALMMSPEATSQPNNDSKKIGVAQVGKYSCLMIHLRWLWQSVLFDFHSRWMTIFTYDVYIYMYMNL